MHPFSPYIKMLEIEVRFRLEKEKSDTTILPEWRLQKRSTMDNLVGKAGQARRGGAAHCAAAATVRGLLRPLNKKRGPLFPEGLRFFSERQGD
jgi:hypothetical protein